MRVNRILFFLLMFLSTVAFSQKKSIKISVYFDSDVSSLNKVEQSKLDALISLVRFQKIDSIILEAHADSNSSLIYNDNLSKRRLNFVRKQFNAISKDTKFNQSYFGERKTMNFDQFIYKLSLDRRVDVTIFLQKEMDIKELYKSNSKIGEKFFINHSRDTIIETKYGDKLRIKANSFCSETDGVIELRITKYYDKSEIVLNDLNTVTTKNEILESDGMMNIEAFQDGVKLCNKLNNSIQLSMKTDSVKPGMKLIYGEFDKDSVHKWEWDTYSSSSNVDKEIDGGGDRDSVAGKYRSCFESWFGCCGLSCGGNDSVFSSYYRDSIYMMRYLENKKNYFEISPYIENATRVENKKMTLINRVFWGKKKKRRKRDETLVYLKKRKTTDSLIFINPNCDSGLLKQKEIYEKVYSKQNFPETFADNNLYLPYTQVGIKFFFNNGCARNCGVYELFSPLEVDSSFLAELMELKASCEEINKYKEIGLAKRLLKMTNEEILQIELDELEGYIAKIDTLANSLVDSYIRKEIQYDSAQKVYYRFPIYLKLRVQEMLAKGEINLKEYLELLPTASAEDFTSYQFKLSNLGLVNIDAVQNFDGERYDLVVKVKTQSCDYKLVFNSIKSVLPAERSRGDKNTIVFRNIPENQSVTLVGINYIDDDKFPVQFVKKEFTTVKEDNLMILEFGEKITMKKLKEEMQKLD